LPRHNLCRGRDKDCGEAFDGGGFGVLLFLQTVLELQDGKILLQLQCLRLGVDLEDFSFVLKGYQFAEVVRSLLPSDAIRDKDEMSVMALLINDPGDVTQDVRLFASSRAVGLGLDQDRRIGS